MDRKISNDGKTMLLYIAYADALEGKMAKIGVTTGTFEERWRVHNAGNPPALMRKEFFSIRLPKECARRVEKHIKDNYTEQDAGEWVSWSPTKLKEIVVGLIFMLCKEARKDLARVVDGRKQRDYVFNDTEVSNVSIEGQTTPGSRRARGVCQDCGDDLDNPNNNTRCSKCQREVYERDKRRQTEKDQDDPQPDG